MELQPREVDVLEEYLGALDSLIGDQRTRGTFRGVIKGIIASESLVCAKIARFSPRLCLLRTRREESASYGSG
jgi:hypothetical protein